MQASPEKIAVWAVGAQVRESFSEENDPCAERPARKQEVARFRAGKWGKVFQAEGTACLGARGRSWCI